MFSTGSSLVSNEVSYMTNILRKTLTRILNITMVYSSNTIVSNRVSMFYSLNKLVADLVSTLDSSHAYLVSHLASMLDSTNICVAHFVLKFNP